MLCDTPQLVHYAVSRLRCSPRIIVDCEGQDLGCDTGLLSIISVGTEDARAIFLFDVRLVSKAAIQPLVDLLADRLVPKLMWDGRRDSIEVRREFNVEIGRPWDLQLVDITSRKLRGIVGSHEFATRSSQPPSTMAHVDAADVHTLTSLKSVLTVHGVQQPAGAPAGDVVDHSRWLQRPLPAHYLRYAENDIELIARVATLFRLRGYLCDDTKLLESQSSRYLAVHDGPLYGDNVFLGSNILPMGVLSNVPVPGEALRRCDRCLRSLSRSCFLYTLTSLGNGRQSYSSCKVCYVLAERNGVATSRTPSPTEDPYPSASRPQSRRRRSRGKSNDTSTVVVAPVTISPPERSAISTQGARPSRRVRRLLASSQEPPKVAPTRDNERGPPRIKSRSGVVVGTGGNSGSKQQK